MPTYFISQYTQCAISDSLQSEGGFGSKYFVTTLLEIQQNTAKSSDSFLCISDLHAIKTQENQVLSKHQ